MEPMTHLERAVAQATLLVRGVTDDQLTNATLCEEWDVRALIGHMLGGALMFATAAEKGSVPQPVLQEVTSPDLVGDDFRERFERETGRLLEACRRPGALDGMLELPFGKLPGPMMLSIATMDLTIHSGDLALATGQSFDDTDLAETSIEVGRRNEAAMGGALRSPNVFGPEHPCADDAPAITRLLAYAGRKV